MQNILEEIVKSHQQFLYDSSLSDSRPALHIVSTLAVKVV